MAKQEVVTTTYTSDLSGKTITDNDQPTVSFSLDGKGYEIDLSDKEQTKMRDALAEYVQHARSGSTKTRATKRTQVASAHDPNAVRAWAKANGHEVSERGRISKSVTEAYEAAQN